MSSPRKPSDAISRIRQMCRYSVAGIRLYQGLVPKLLGSHPDEVIMTKAFGMPENLQSAASYEAGTAEIGLALYILLLPGGVWPRLCENAFVISGGGKEQQTSRSANGFSGSQQRLLTRYRICSGN